MKKLPENKSGIKTVTNPHEIEIRKIFKPGMFLKESPKKGKR